MLIFSEQCAAPILHGEQITFLHMLTLHRWDVHGPCSTWRQAQDNWSRAPIRVWRPDYYPLTGCNPGLSLACLLDITPWEDIYISWGYIITPFVGNVVLRRKPQSTFCVSVSLTQVYISGFLHFGPGGQWGTRYGGHLELC